MVVVPAGVEPAISWMRTRRPGPLDDETTTNIIAQNSKIQRKFLFRNFHEAYSLISVRSGFVDNYISASKSGLLNVANGGDQWSRSSTTTRDTHSYALTVYVNTIYSSYEGVRRYGLPLRCLAN